MPADLLTNAVRALTACFSHIKICLLSKHLVHFVARLMYDVRTCQNPNEYVLPA